jgi:hypothetical protein
MVATRWAALALLAVGLGGAAYTLTRADEPDERWCAGAGIGPGPRAPNPEGAFLAWVLAEGGDPSEWKKLSDLSYEPPDPEMAGYESVEVEQHADGTFAVGGVCASSPSP